jgi:carboxypeptidase Taq
MGFLAGQALALMVGPEMEECLAALEGAEGLSPPEAAMLRSAKREFDKYRAVPPQEYAEFQALTGESEAAWREAKPKGDFGAMLPYFTKIFAFSRKLSAYFGTYPHVYDGLLDDYEEGSNVAELDAFFAGLKADIVPLLQKITERGQPETPALPGPFDRRRQKMLTFAVSRLIGLDMQGLRIGETEHPFAMDVAPGDVRFATHYREDNLFSALYSTIHEGGHALYEQGFPAELHPFGLDRAASMAFHESQSRFCENVLGRSRAFMRHLLPRLQTLWPAEFDGVTEDALYKAVNVVSPSLIRTESDELTYCLHICARYELEKEIMTDNVNLSELPGLWNAQYTSLLGITPQNNTEGVLQDTHWPAGLVGYFPSYAVGNAIAAQLLAAMNRSFNVEDAVAAGDFAAVRGWMREHVHAKGGLLKPADLLRQATGEGLNVKYYTQYLKDKFSSIYF